MTFLVAPVTARWQKRIISGHSQLASTLIRYWKRSYGSKFLTGKPLKAYIRPDIMEETSKIFGLFALFYLPKSALISVLRPQMALLGFYIEMRVSTIFPTTLCRDWDSNSHQRLFRDFNRTLNRPSYRGRGKKRRRWKNYFYSRNGNVYGLDESAAFESKARNRPQRKSFGAFFFMEQKKKDGFGIQVFLIG